MRALLRLSAEALNNSPSMTFISRLCTRRVPPEAMRALPMSLDTSVRRCTAARMAASSSSIS